MTEIEIAPGLRLSSGLSLFLEDIRTLVIADVHWGYATSQRWAGRLFPEWGDADIDERLLHLLAWMKPETLVIVGDIVHTAAGEAAARRTLERIGAEVRVVLVGGNHDRRTGLRTVASHRQGRFFFHHGDGRPTVPDGCLEILGHVHPAAAWHDGAGTRLRLPGCVCGPRRIILPAFSPWAAGVPWNHRLEPGERLWLVSPDRIFPLAKGNERHSVNS